MRQKLLDKDYAIEKLQGIVGSLEKKVKELKTKDRYGTREVSPRRETSEA